VAILRGAILKFRQIFLDMANVEPFTVASTCAKLSMHIYRKQFLPFNTMVNTPEQGFRAGQRQSVLALKWMRLYELTHNLPPGTIRTREYPFGEARVGDSGKRLDGLLQRDGQRPLALEFMGCYFHGRC
jgi:hypothetical protein